MKKLVLIAAVIGIAGISWAASPTTATPQAGVSQPHGMHGMHGMASGQGHRHGMKDEKHTGQAHEHGQGDHGKMHGMGMSQHQAKMGCDPSMHEHSKQQHRHQ